MNIATVFIALIFLLAFAFGLRNAVKHFRGDGGCCGGGSAAPPSEPKKLQGPMVSRKLLSISGMHCMHCAQSVTKALNCLEGVSATVHLARQSAVVEMDREVPDDALRAAVSGAGFEVTAIQTC